MSDSHRDVVVRCEGVSKYYPAAPDARDLMRALFGRPARKEGKRALHEVDLCVERGASVGIVYQRAGKDMPKLTLAVNNLVSDLGGMLCDGAKEGCALKVASSTNSAIRSAHMALNDHGITQVEGFVGLTAEDTIRSLSQIGSIGMSLANDTMLDIMIEKSSGLTGRDP